jgi:lipopolysaccharide biosynthesis glycosyltransferase
MEIFNDTAITFTCDQKYSPYSEILIKSIQKNSPNLQIVLRLVNCNKQTIERISNLDTNITTIVENIELSTKRNISCSNKELMYEGLLGSFFENKTKIKPARFLVSEQITYCSNIKFDTINKLLEAGAKNIIYMDVDSIVRRELTPLIDIMQTGDICMFKDKPYTEQHRGSKRLQGQTVLYHGGLICVRNTQRSTELISSWKETVSNNIFDWDIDEQLLSDVTSKTNIAVVDLPVCFKDENLNNSSYIWSGAGETKFSNNIYLNECRHYIDNL